MEIIYESFMEIVFSFENFITPRIITAIYWLKIIIIVIIGFSIMFSGIGGNVMYSSGSWHRQSVTFLSFISGTMFIVFGILLARMLIELVLVLFRIHDHLKAIRDK